MVTVYGLNEEVGNITYYDSSGNDAFVKPYSEETGKKIDKEISKMIEFQYKRAIQLLEENKEKLTVLAELLLEREVIFKDDLVKIFGKRPFENEVDDTIEEKPTEETETDTVNE
jgi:cell division protease FtsH